MSSGCAWRGAPRTPAGFTETVARPPWSVREHTVFASATCKTIRDELLSPDLANRQRVEIMRESLKGCLIETIDE